MEWSGMRVTPVQVEAGVGVTTEVDVTNVRSMVVTEMVKYGTNPSEISMRLGDSGDFFDPAPGDCIHGFYPVRRLVIRNNTAAIKKVVLVLHESADFRFFNTPRGL